MIQIIREKLQGPITWAIILAIAIAFALIGGDSFTRSFRMGSDVAALVDGEAIPWSKVEHIFQAEAKANPQLANLPQEQKNLVYAEIRDGLAKELAVKSQLIKQGFVVTDSQVLTRLKEDKNFHVNGVFNKERYLELLRSNFLTEEYYEDILRSSILRHQVATGLGISGFVLPEELSKLQDLWFQARNFGYVEIPAAKFYDEVEVTADAISEYYKLHKPNFVAPERLKLSYVSLNLDTIAAKVVYTDDEVKNYYEEHINYFSKPEKVKVAHILVAVKDAEQDDVTAKAKIEAIYDKLSLGESFANLAKENSDDYMSAKVGGDLGWIDRGATVEPFEEAAFSLQQPDDLSQIVKTQFGYHIIKLQQKQEKRSMPLEEVKEYVVKSLQRERAEADFAKLGEEFTAVAAENTDNLEPIAKALGLEINTSDYITKDDFSNLPKFLQNGSIITAAFSSELAEQGKNSEAMHLDAERYVVFRVSEHKAAYIKEEEQVATDIKTILMQHEAGLRAESTAKNMVQRLRQGAAPYSLAKEQRLTWQVQENALRYDTSVDPGILQYVFAMSRPQGGQHEVVNFKKENGDHVVIALTKVSVSETDDDRKINEEQLQKVQTEEDYALLQQALIARANVKLKPSRR